jgi:DNA modification methylase
MANISDLKFDHKNARKRTDSSARLIQESLQRYGAARSIVIDEENRILAGNGTIEGAKALGLTKLKVVEAAGDEIIAVRRSGLSEDDKVGLALADNRAAELSDWDAEMLQQLSEEHDIAPWFEQEDLDALLQEAEQLEPVEGNTDPDEVPEAPEDPITKPGDLWILGNHRLLCGDSTNIQHIERLMDGQKADMVFTDPPYGMNLDTDYSKMGTSTKTYKQVHDDDKPFDAGAMMKLLPAPVWYIWGADYFCKSIPLWEQGSTLIWAKAHSEDENKVYGSSFEVCWRFPKAKKELWFVRRIHMTDEHLKAHPTQKPCELPVRAIEKDSKLGNLVVDLYGGSGTTLIACEKTSRHCRMMELDPAYCDVIVKRWEDFTGNTAICQPSNAHFTPEPQEAF